MSGAVAVFNILQLLALPTIQENNNDIAAFNGHQNRLITKLFDQKSYDRRKPSHYPVQTAAFLFIDHVENIDELAQTMKFHGSLILSWVDHRLVWEPQDYGNINMTDVTHEIHQIWRPSVYFRTLVMATSKIIQQYNTAVSVDNEGHVTSISSISVMTECRMDYTDYPFENQTCAVMLVSPMSNSMKMLFTDVPIILPRNSLFGHGENNMTKGANFDVVGMRADRYFYFLGGLTKNATLSPFSSTVLRFEVQLKRNAGHYLSLVALPLFATSVCAYIAACMSRSTVSLVWLAACLIMQFVNYSRIVEELPPDYNTTPFCAKLTGLIFGETLALFLYRLVMILLYNHSKTGKEVQILSHIEHSIAFLLILSGVANFWLLIV